MIFGDLGEIYPLNTIHLIESYFNKIFSTNNGLK